MIVGGGGLDSGKLRTICSTSGSGSLMWNVGTAGHIGKLHCTDSFGPANEYTVPTHSVPANSLDRWLHI